MVRRSSAVPPSTASRRTKADVIEHTLDGASTDAHPCGAGRGTVIVGDREHDIVGGQGRRHRDRSASGGASPDPGELEAAGADAIVEMSTTCDELLFVTDARG